ncbi:MAG: extracellular solute-binding protein [Anaerolineales bacterium]|nr:extracellular solute-binding protein [Anaerolineales bacterium]
MTKKTLTFLMLLVFLLSAVLVACQPAAPEEAPEEAAPEEAAPEEAAGTYYERAMAGEFDGTVVTMTGPFTDEDAVKFDNSVAAFEEASGIDVQYEGSKEFEAAIGIRVEAGDPPDIVDFPQPGLLATFVAQGEVVDVSTFLPESSFDNYIQSWWDMATMDSPDGPIVAGVWHRFFGKSQVWYPQEEFEAAGYEIPTTWDELVTLSDQIVADGDKPWCVGIESGAATGWPATDWMEEVMLRTTSLENYDKWVTGELPFSSPEVKNALSVLDALWADEYVYGGQEAIVTTFFGDAPTPMFEDPPKCWLHKQGNFIVSFFPEGVEGGKDYGFFYLPSIDDAYGKPYLVAGDLMAMFNDRPEVRAVMEFFTHGEALKEWMAAGGGLSPHKDASLDWYGDNIERGIAALVADATSVRFDGSDLMPGEVGAGSFWKGMTDFFAGVADMDTVMDEIDASWPGMEGEAMEEEAMEESAGMTVTFWHVWGTGGVGEGMTALVDNFNATNEYGITVEAVDQGRYGDAEDAMNAAIQSGDVPNAIVGYPNAVSNWYSVGVIADLQPFVDDPEVGLTADELADFYPAAYNGGVAVDGARIAWPISQSANVVFYNSTWAQELGFAAPPTNAAEFKEQACAATAANAGDDDPDNDGTGGLVLYPSASNFMSFLFAFGDDGMAEDGSGYEYATAEAQAVAEYWKTMWDEGCAFPTESYPNPEFATRKALFTMSSTAGMPYQLSAFEAEGAMADDEWFYLPFFGPDGQMAVDAFGQYVAMVNTTPEQNQATWMFFKYLTSPEAQATWINASAYYPVRVSAEDLLKDYADANPKWVGGLGLMQYGQTEPSRGSWASVRRSLGDTGDLIIQGVFEEIPTYLQDLDTSAAEAVAEIDE